MMELISGAIHSPAAPAGIQTPDRIQAPRRENPRSAPAAPVTDEYVPEKTHTPSGRYWIGRDRDGSPKVFFDNPEPETAGPSGDEKAPPPEGPEKPASGGRAEQCTCDTGRVDREIKRLKERRDRLEQQLRTETDGTRVRELERQLAQVDRELSQKDNDTYRRQHAEFS